MYIKADVTLKITDGRHCAHERAGRIIASPEIIGDGFLIGTCVIILPVCKVGRGVIIGAGAVVAKDVPGYAVNAGNPELSDTEKQNLITKKEHPKNENRSYCRRKA